MRILFAAPNLPYPRISGGAQRTAALLETLLGLGDIDCCFLPASLKDSNNYTIENATIKAITPTDEIRISGAGKIGSYLPRQLQAFLLAERHRWRPYKPLINKLGDLSRYDLIVARYLSTACILDLFRHPKLMIDVDDYDPDRLKLRIANGGILKNLTLRHTLKHSLRAHKSMLPHAAHCWVSNYHDKENSELNHATILPNIPHLKDDQLPIAIAPPPDSKIILMVGTFSYSANVNGAEAFIRYAWPQILVQHPNAELHLIGGGLPKKTQLKWQRNPGLKVRGFVQDLSLAYQQSSITISPILAGAGTNIKVLESAAYTRTPVVSKVALRGFEAHFTNNKSCIAADTIAQMAAGCIELLSNNELNQYIARNANQVIQDHYTRKKFDIAVQEAIEKVLN